MVTPNVAQEVREYFNCSELEGAELEDQGEEGTVLTHWEKRVFEVRLPRQRLPHSSNLAIFRMKQ